MERDVKANRKRTVLSVLLIIFTIFTLLYMSREMHHECSHELCHEDCPICRIINLSTLSLELLIYALACAFVAFSFHIIRKNSTPLICKSVINLATLISQKIRIND